MRSSLALPVLLLLLAGMPALTSAQEHQVPGVQVPAVNSEGLPIGSVVIVIEEDGVERLADSTETAAFYKAFDLRPGALFRQSVADGALDRVRAVPEVMAAEYVLLNTEPSGPLTVLVKVRLSAKAKPAPQGAVFPDLIKTKRSRLLVMLNGGVGLFNEVNAFFGQGEAFTQGNPVATDPAGQGIRFWGETYVEPGVAAIFQLAQGKVQPYGALSYMATARNTSDIYSADETLFGAVERAYLGIYMPKLGRKEDLSIDLSAGRQFFQLRDGFLFSKYSGSSNAGERGSVFLNARTTYEHSAIGKVQYRRFTATGFFLEPQELFPDKGSDRQYLGADLNFNDRKHFDAGLAYITVPSSKGSYSTPTERITQEGMYIINPKLWVSDIGGTGLFVKSEYAYQSHATADMLSHAWYAAVGMRKQAWKGSPSLMYRYGFMQGDDPNTATYERFDAIQTGGLGNWVQGIDFRKVVGNGNFIAHRIELKGYASRSTELSLDLFLLGAHQLENRGALAPISQLKALDYGTEVTLTARWFVTKHLLLLGVLSHAEPGSAIRSAFETEVRSWTSYQCALFLFI